MWHIFCLRLKPNKGVSFFDNHAEGAPFGDSSFMRRHSALSFLPAETDDEEEM